MAHRSEQGNILGFVLVGALLVALLLGGIYVVRNSMVQVATGGDDTAGNGATDTASDGSSAPARDTTNDESTDKSDEQRLKETLEAQSAAEQKAREQQAANQAASGTAAQEASDTSHLPATGPEEAVLPVVGATLLAGAGLSYVRSRRLI